MKEMISVGTVTSIFAFNSRDVNLIFMDEMYFLGGVFNRDLLNIKTEPLYGDANILAVEVYVEKITLNKD